MCCRLVLQEVQDGNDVVRFCSWFCRDSPYDETRESNWQPLLPIHGELEILYVTLAAAVTAHKKLIPHVVPAEMSRH